MNLTTLISKLEKQVRIAEKIASRYQARAEALRGKLDKVARLLGGKTVEKIEVTKIDEDAPKTKGRRRGMSAAGRARVAEAQRQRWAKIRAKTGGKKAGALPSGKTTGKIAKVVLKKGGRRGMSAAGRARIAEAQRQRWAKFHAKSVGKKTVAKRGRRRGHLSAAGRAAIIAGQQRRWAAKGKKVS